MAECDKGSYRPRRPRETAFYRLVEEHYERFEQAYFERYEVRYGFLRPVIRETVYKYLGCGDLKQGFAGVRCRDCGHEYLVAYSCKRRYFCTSCHTKRAVAFAEWLHETVLWPVAHRQIVLTIPKILRAYFRYDRRLLGNLCRVAAEVLVASFRVLLDEVGKDAVRAGPALRRHAAREGGAHGLRPAERETLLLRRVR